LALGSSYTSDISFQFFNEKRLPEINVSFCGRKIQRYMLKILRLGSGQLIKLKVRLGMSSCIQITEVVEMTDGVVEVQDLLRFVFGGKHIKENN